MTLGPVVITDASSDISARMDAAGGINPLSLKPWNRLPDHLKNAWHGLKTGKNETLLPYVVVNK